MDSDIAQPHKKRSETVLKWAIFLVAIGTSVFGVLLALICIYAIPGNISHPLAGTIYFLGSVSIIICLIIFPRTKGPKE